MIDRFHAIFRFGLVGLLAMLFGWSPVAAVETIAFDELERGQRGHGLSVFSGSEPEAFEVEVVGVLRNSAPDLDYLLVRVSGHDLERSGVVAGMSGSPIFFEGRLAGALSFSWTFSQDAIGGVTPIGRMRELVSGASMAMGTGVGGGTPQELLETGTDLERLGRELQRLRPVLTGNSHGSIAWGLSGFDPTTEAWLSRSLSGIAPMGEALEGAGEADLEPGSAVAAVLIDGDLRMAATGTVTDRQGDEIVAFGHPFLGLGPVDIPMAEAEVVTVLSNRATSFKISNSGRIVGAFRDDRITGVTGLIGARAATVPLHLSIGGGTTRDFSMRLARIEGLTSTLVGISVFGAQEAAFRSAGPMGLDLKATFDLGAYGLLELEQSFDGPAAAAGATVYLMAFSHFLMDNAFAEVTVERIEVEIEQHSSPRTMTIVGGYAERTEVRPGDLVRLHVDLVPYRGEAERRHLTVRLPSDLPAGRYSLLVGDGVSLDAARMVLEPAAPVSFDQALRLVRRFHSRRDLVVLGLFSGRGLAVAGEVMPRLPGTVQSVWSAAGSQSAVPLRFAVVQEHVARLDAPVEGAVRVDLTVERREPMSSEGGSTQGEGAKVEGGGGVVGEGRAGGAEEVGGEVGGDR